MTNKNINVTIGTLLREIGVPVHILGYKYLKEAIKMALYDPSVIDRGITKLMYPHVAQFHDTTPSRVERAIRHAIEVTWDRGCADKRDAIFIGHVSPDTGLPVNSEFIATVAEYLRENYMTKDE